MVTRDVTGEFPDLSYSEINAFIFFRHLYIFYSAIIRICRRDWIREFYFGRVDFKSKTRRGEGIPFFILLIQSFRWSGVTLSSFEWKSKKIPIQLYEWLVNFVMKLTTPIFQNLIAQSKGRFVSFGPAYALGQSSLFKKYERKNLEFFTRMISVISVKV